MNDAAFIFCLFLFVACSMEGPHWIFDASITMFLGKLFKKHWSEKFGLFGNIRYSNPNHHCRVRENCEGRYNLRGFIPLYHLHLHVLTRCDGNNDYYSKEKAVVQFQLFLLKTFLSHRERSRAKILDSVCWTGQPPSHHFPTWVKTVGGSILIKLESHPIPHPQYSMGISQP